MPPRGSWCCDRHPPIDHKQRLALDTNRRGNERVREGVATWALVQVLHRIRSFTLPGPFGHFKFIVSLFHVNCLNRLGGTERERVHQEAGGSVNYIVTSSWGTMKTTAVRWREHKVHVFIWKGVAGTLVVCFLHLLPLSIVCR